MNSLINYPNIDASSKFIILHAFVIMQINWIGSNYHNPAAANSGSGIFTTEGTISYYHNVTKDSRGKLLVAELPVHPNKLPVPIKWNEYVNNNGARYPFGETRFQSLIYGDIFDMVEMDPDKTEVGIR